MGHQHACMDHRLILLHFLQEILPACRVMNHERIPVNDIRPGSHLRIIDFLPVIAAHIHFRHIQVCPQGRQHLSVLLSGHSHEMLQLRRVPAGLRRRSIVARHPLGTEGDICRFLYTWFLHIRIFPAECFPFHIDNILFQLLF